MTRCQVPRTQSGHLWGEPLLCQPQSCFLVDLISHFLIRRQQWPPRQSPHSLQCMKITFSAFAMPCGKEVIKTWLSLSLVQLEDSFFIKGTTSYLLYLPHCLLVLGSYWAVFGKWDVWRILCIFMNYWRNNWGENPGDTESLQLAHASPVPLRPQPTSPRDRQLEWRSLRTARPPLAP